MTAQLNLQLPNTETGCNGDETLTKLNSVANFNMSQTCASNQDHRECHQKRPDQHCHYSLVRRHEQEWKGLCSDTSQTRDSLARGCCRRHIGALGAGIQALRIEVHRHKLPGQIWDSTLASASLHLDPLYARRYGLGNPLLQQACIGRGGSGAQCLHEPC